TRGALRPSAGRGVGGEPPSQAQQPFVSLSYRPRLASESREKLLAAKFAKDSREAREDKHQEVSCPSPLRSIRFPLRSNAPSAVRRFYENVVRRSSRPLACRSCLGGRQREERNRARGRVGRGSQGNSRHPRRYSEGPA